MRTQTRSELAEESQAGKAVDTRVGATYMHVLYM